ncbi:hypothetical protein O3P69_007856 [Scylla paramamosain]|uniref:Uncharacterized protein n=1 Tax=Scylla paramamosain TaxID=85552 RepID=A0AAW0SKG2_SCYPA
MQLLNSRNKKTHIMQVDQKGLTARRGGDGTISSPTNLPPKYSTHKQHLCLLTPSQPQPASFLHALPKRMVPLPLSPPSQQQQQTLYGQ